MFIRSERLFLRPGWPEDWEDLLGAIADEGVIRNLARAPWPYGAADAQAFARLPQNPRVPHFVVTLPGLGPDARGAALIGGAGFHAVPEDDGQAIELGYWIAPRFQGRGYATEAVRALLRLAPTLGYHRVRAHHFLDNPASGRVLRKAGFVPTGEVSRRPSLARPALSPAATFEIAIPRANDDDAAEPGNVAMRRLLGGFGYPLAGLTGPGATTMTIRAA